MLVQGLTESTLPWVLAEALAAVALVLLAASGLSKTFDPDPTRGAMSAAGLPSSRGIARGLGVAEMVAAVTGLAFGGAWLAIGAVLYLGFALFTFAAVQKRLPIQSCGCFGREDTPPTTLHVVFNTVSTIALAYLVFTGASAVPWAEPPLELALYLSFSMVGAYLAYLVLSQLPRTLKMTTEP
jgi:hypothetical protein